MAGDAALLARYARSRDAEAFGELARRYARLVYATCLRVTGNIHDAEDVAQECFLALMRSAGSVRTHLPAWLYATATNRSLNLLRSIARRRRHEEQASSPAGAQRDAAWAEIEPRIDRALMQLPDELRVPLVLRYMDDRTQSEIARELGVSQPTVSRRLEKGLEELRARLKVRGATMAPSLLPSVLQDYRAPDAPASLASALGKMAMAGLGDAVSTGPPVGPALLVKVLAAAAVVVAVCAAILIAGRRGPSGQPQPAGGTQETAAVGGETGSPVAREEAQHMEPRVSRQGGNVWIEGVQAFENIDEGLSHLRAIACVLGYYGEEVEWNWLMGASGEAFCYYYHPDGTYLSLFVHSWDVANAALAAYGYEGEWHAYDTADVAPALALIESELSEGRPAIAPGIMPSFDGIHSQCNYWFVVTGVDSDRRKVTLLGAAEDPIQVDVPHGDSPRPEWHPRWYGIFRSFDGVAGHYGPPGADNPVLAIRKADQPAPPADVAAASLRRAVRLAREESATASFGWGAGTYLGGLAAIRRLHEDLQAARGDGLAEYSRLHPVGAEPFGGLGAELQSLGLLARRRTAAAAYLALVAPLMPEAARPHLDAAARHYRASAAEAGKAFAVRYGSETELARMWAFVREGRADESNRQWVEYWQRADEALADAARRQTMGEHVARVLDSEQAAVAELDKAIALLN